MTDEVYAAILRHGRVPTGNVLTVETKLDALFVYAAMELLCEEEKLERVRKQPEDQQDSYSLPAQ